MTGVSVVRDSHGNVILINAVDCCGLPSIYNVLQYEERGYEPDWRTLPDEVNKQ